MSEGRVRIGCGSAYAEDRIEPAVDLVEQGELDYLALDCLAERTLVHAQLRRLEDPDKGYDIRLDRLVRELTAPAVERGITFIANMGAANPAAGARRTKELLAELGHPDTKVAAITGDDVLEYVLERDLRLSNGKRPSEMDYGLVSANAYIGIDPIIESLRRGANVIVGGRIADPSLFLAPAAFEFEWPLDDWDLLAGGQVAGHLLECGTHGSGGNFADPPYRMVPDLWNLGLPIADVYPDGTSTIWKLPGTGGAVDVENCKAQLVYEIHDPSTYLTPDLTVDMREVTLEQKSHDHVFVQGARGRARPDTLKVLVGVREGFTGEGEVSFAGPGALSRAQLAADTVTKRLAHDGVVTEELRIDYIGLNSVHGDATPADAPEPWEVRLRLAARCNTEEAAAAVAQEVEFVYFGSAAGGGVRKTVKPVLAMYSALVPREDVSVTVDILEG
ncbi:MAG: DUF1446 domain-containing protein [Actinobacteria bacterium]|nr:DUF1446 domain-containing protein [Actinomycetota bacterium]